MRGKAKIELFNAETGELERSVEDHNLVTNALSYIINIEAARGAALTENIFPIATNALGGLMLFDGELEESANNVHMPTKDVHLVGYASTDVNTSDPHRGSFNSIESGPTEDGYVSVWDFGTSQANGVIKSVARTHTWSGQNPIVQYMNGLVSTNSGAPSSNTSLMPIRYDGEYVYMIKAFRTTDSKYVIREYRVRKPKLRMCVADYPSRFEDYEFVAEWDALACEFSYNYYQDVQTKKIWADSPWFYYDGRDGYYYCAYAGYDPDKTAGLTLNLFTIHYGDGSYEKSAFKKIDLQAKCYMNGGSVSDYSYDDETRRWNTTTRYYNYLNGRGSHRIANGFLYLLTSDRKSFLRVNLKNTADQKLIRVIEEESSDYIYNIPAIMLSTGGLYFTILHYLTGSSEYRNGLLYEDGNVLLHDFTGTSSLNNWDYYTVDGDELEGFGYYDYSSPGIYQGFISNYLGTIANLSSPIEKNASQTMKITYTLTDKKGE